jgi:LmbE family N-acetylglucosaminyl deacetylase
MMKPPFPENAVPVRRPHYAVKDGALYFLISRRPHAPLAKGELAVWEAIDGKTSLAELRKRFPDAGTVLERFVRLGVCEIPQADFPPDRRRVLIIEPHMDDAALSVGGTMWLRRNECEFTVATLAGISNFTTYYMLLRGFFEIGEVTALRKAESALVLRHVGGRHMTVDLLEAPLRYKHARWSLDWYKQHREAVSAFLRHSPGPRELEEWSAAIARLLASVDAEEIWMPLGVGLHVDHQLTRDACLRVITANPGLVLGRQLRFYEDVPYNGDWPGHACQVVEVLNHSGARLQPERVDIGEAFAEKLHLLGIFGSQFKMAVMGPRVEKSARLDQAGAPGLAEMLYKLETPPSGKMEPFACYLEKDRVSTLAKDLAPWLARHRLASAVTIFVPTAFGRWAEDMQFLLDLFPRANFEVVVSRLHVPEAETFSSPRIHLRPVESGRLAWYAAAARLFLTRPNPLVIISSPGKERHARRLKAGCFGCDSIVASRWNDFILGLRQATTA